MAHTIRWYVFYFFFLINFRFLKSLALKGLKKILHGDFEILRIRSWADNITVYNYRLHFSRFLLRRTNTASDSFVLIDSTVSQWLFLAKLAGSFLLRSTLWLAVLIRFTKPFIGLSKHVIEVAIKKYGSSRQAVPQGFAAWCARVKIHLNLLARLD